MDKTLFPSSQAILALTRCLVALDLTFIAYASSHIEPSYCGSFELILAVSWSVTLSVQVIWFSYFMPNALQKELALLTINQSTVKFQATFVEKIALHAVPIFLVLITIYTDCLNPNSIVNDILFECTQGPQCSYDTRFQRYVLNRKYDKKWMTYFIENGASINSWGRCGTPLTLAVFAGDGKMVRHLLENNADPNPNPEKWSGSTLPLEYALYRATDSVHFKGIALLLLDHGANCGKYPPNKLLVPAIYAKDRDLLIRILNLGISTEYLNDKVNPPLFIAIRSENLDAMSELASRGADLNICANGETPLLLALRLNKVDMVRWLLRHGAEIEGQATRERLRNLASFTEDEIK